MAQFHGSAGQKMDRGDRCLLRKRRNQERRERMIALNEERQKTAVKVTGLRSAVRTKMMSGEEALKKLNTFEWVPESTRKWYERRAK